MRRLRGVSERDRPPGARRAHRRSGARRAQSGASGRDPARRQPARDERARFPESPGRSRAACPDPGDLRPGEREPGAGEPAARRLRLHGKAGRAPAPGRGAREPRAAPLGSRPRGAAARATPRATRVRRAPGPGPRAERSRMGVDVGEPQHVRDQGPRDRLDASRAGDDTHADSARRRCAPGGRVGARARRPRRLRVLLPQPHRLAGPAPADAAPAIGGRPAVARRAVPPHLAPHRPAGQGIIGRVAASGSTVHLSDATESLDLWPGAPAIAREEGIHVLVCVPIQSRGETLGVLSLARRTPEPFTQSEIALVEASANQLGLALANAQLYAETRRRLEDLKAAEAHLIEGEKLSTVGKLPAGLAHEVRNRLTAILGHTELLLMGADDAAHARQRLNTIVDETSGAAQMLQNLLRFSGTQTTERQLCHLRDQIHWVLEVKGGALGRDGIRVVTELDSVPPVRADETQLQQVLLNLVQNAHQALAAHAGERVLTVRLSETEGTKVRLEVLDTGPGIPPELLPRIFDAFSTTKPRSEGTGLGLWVSCAILKEHKGTLRAENRAGGGAAFVIELPAATA